MRELHSTEQFAVAGGTFFDICGVSLIGLGVGAAIGTAFKNTDIVVITPLGSVFGGTDKPTHTAMGSTVLAFIGSSALTIAVSLDSYFYPATPTQFSHLLAASPLSGE